MADNGAHEVLFPVDFRPGGDTTRDAFHKHIQEIARIYGQISDLDSHKMDSDTLTNSLNEHIQDSNPHPNYKPSIPIGNVTGNIPASRVVGALTQATIDKSRVTGLETYVQGLIPEIPETGDGITDSKISERGSITFKNGLIIQWGISADVGVGYPNKEKKEMFPKKFPNACYIVVATTLVPGGSGHNTEWDTFRMFDWDQEGFEFSALVEYQRKCSYIAIGR